MKLTQPQHAFPYFSDFLFLSFYGTDFSYKCQSVMRIIKAWIIYSGVHADADADVDVDAKC